MKKPKMILVCGPDSSQKDILTNKLINEYHAALINSTQYMQNANILTDKSILKQYKTKIKKNLRHRINVIVNLPNLTIKNRRAILHLASNLEKEKICYVILSKDYKLQDNSIDFNAQYQLKKFCLPTCEEGFDKIYIQNN